jgi:GNAT superfamily N-acetyltransferase
MTAEPSLLDALADFGAKAYDPAEPRDHHGEWMALGEALRTLRPSSGKSWDEAEAEINAKHPTYLDDLTADVRDSALGAVHATRDGRVVRNHAMLLAARRAKRPMVLVARVDESKAFDPAEPRDPATGRWVTLFHITDKHHFALDPKRAPQDNAFAIQDRSGRRGIYLTDDPDHWRAMGYHRPYVAEIRVPEGLAYDERWGGEKFLPAEHFDQATVTRVIPFDAYQRERWGEPGSVETFFGTHYENDTPIEMRPTSAGNFAREAPVSRVPEATDVRTISKEAHQRHLQRLREYRRATQAKAFDPSEPRDEQGRWVDLEHGTSQWRADEILKSGFHAGRGEGGYGVYFSPLGQQYETVRDAEVRIHARFKAHNTLVMGSGKDDPGYQEYLDAAQENSARPDIPLAAKGYDSVEYHDPWGNTQFIVFDPSKIQTVGQIGAPQVKAFDPAERRDPATGEWVAMFHGSRHRLKPGTVLEGGHRANQGSGTPGEHVYFSADPQIARTFADYAMGPESDLDAKPRVYLVEPLDTPEVDPDEPAEAQSFRSRQARVVKEVGWASSLPPLTKVFDPDQPRIPKGSPGAGRWGSGVTAHVGQAWRRLVEQGRDEPEDSDWGWDDATDLAQRQIPSMHVMTRVSPTVFKKILTDGRFRTQHEVGTSSGAFSPQMRNIVERALHGDDAPHPIYGYLHPEQEGKVNDSENVLHQYGSVAIAFRDEVKQHTTWTMGDSLDESGIFEAGRSGALGTDRSQPAIIHPGRAGFFAMTAPSPVSAPESTSIHPTAMDALQYGDLDDVAYQPEQYDVNFLEAQIHRDLTPADIAMVSVSKNDPGWSMVRNLCKKNKIPYTIYDIDGDIAEQWKPPAAPASKAFRPDEPRDPATGEWVTLHDVQPPIAQGYALATIDGVPVGSLHHWGTAGTGRHVAAMWVAKEHRRRGIARAMFDFVGDRYGSVEHGEMRSPNGEAFARSHGPQPPPRRAYTNREAEAEGIGPEDVQAVLREAAKHSAAAARVRIKPRGDESSKDLRALLDVVAKFDPHEPRDPATGEWVALFAPHVSPAGASLWDSREARLAAFEDRKARAEAILEGHSYDDRVLRNHIANFLEGNDETRAKFLHFMNETTGNNVTVPGVGTWTPPPPPPPLPPPGKRYAPRSWWEGRWSHTSKSPAVLDPDYPITVEDRGMAHYGYGLYALRGGSGSFGEHSLTFTLPDDARVYAWNGGRMNDDDGGPAAVAHEMGLTLPPSDAVGGWRPPAQWMSEIRRHYDAMVLGPQGGMISENSPPAWIVVFSPEIIQRVPAPAAKSLRDLLDVVAKFDPHEPRDPNGRWMRGEIATTLVTPRVEANTLAWMAERGITAESLHAQASAILDRAGPEALAYGRPWYANAHGHAVRLATEHGVSIEEAAAVLAALSPRNPWRREDDPKYATSGNIENARQVLAAVREPILLRKVTHADVARAKKLYRIDISHLYGTRPMTSDLTAAEQAALDYRAKGLPDNKVKAFRIARREGLIAEVLGGPKVRSFYNNINRVDVSASVTVDSHQVRAMMGRIDLPDKVYEEIASNDGRYQFFADVVRQVATERGIPPHVAQAIIWEQWRLEHPAEFREENNPSNIATARETTLGSVVYAAPTVAKTPKRRRS